MAAQKLRPNGGSKFYSEIGRKGGEAVSQNREHMANIGRKGGERRGKASREAEPVPPASDTTVTDATTDDAETSPETDEEMEARPKMAEDETRPGA